MQFPIALLLAIGALVTLPAAVLAAPPNVLLVVTDDQGYGDIGAFGGTGEPTPNLDALATSGVMLTSFYAQPTCGPSRAALMTGQNPARIGMNFDPLPRSPRGLSASTTTLGELFRASGYRTTFIGKWHLGDQPEHLPVAHGFDSYFGVPYSNDMWPYHHNMPAPAGQPLDPRLQAARARVEITGAAHKGKTITDPSIFPPLPLYEDRRVIEKDPDQALLAERYTQRAIRFFGEKPAQPFFAVLALHTPHVPLFPHPEFAGQSGHDRYGDVIREIDTRIGELVAALRERGQYENTVIIFVSDNGPWLEYGIDAGSAGPFRGGKATSWEGGWRVPAIISWPKELKPGRTDQLMSLVDVLPTLREAVGIDAPGAAMTDGTSRWPVITGRQPAGEARFLYYADFSGQGATSPLGRQLLAIRQGDWKLHVYTHRSRYLGWWFGYEVNPVALYNLAADPAEKVDVQSAHPDVVATLSEAAADELNALCAGTAEWAENTCD